MQAAATHSGVDWLLAYKGVAVAAWLAIFFLAERLRPAVRPSAALGMPATPAARRLRLLRNGALWAGNIALSPLLVVPVSAWAAAHGLAWRPRWWSGGLGLALDLLMLDGLIYWWHRATHELGWLWRFHEVHHLDRLLDTTTALRIHAGEVALSAVARAGAIMLLAMPLASVLAFEALVLSAAIFHHSNLRLPQRLERLLSLAVITPAIHWVHHHRRRADTDANYGTVFSFWDRLWRSRSPTARRPDLVLGVEGAEEEPLVALLLHPFRPATGRRPS